jgi:2-keto-4-pentenoate hydratase
MTVTLFHDDEQVARGTAGEALLDDPFLSLSLLANSLAERGRSLEAGQPVITGSFFSARRVEGPGVWRADFEHIGGVSVAFT